MKLKIDMLYPQEREWLGEMCGPQEYYLHTGFGGRGWNYRFDRTGYFLYISSDKIATMFLLKFSDKHRELHEDHDERV